MLKVASFDIVFQEIPGEVTLALNLSGCPCHCKGCHSKHLWEDIGEPLDEKLLIGLLDRYGSQVTCVCFMGGDREPEEVARLAEYIKNHPSSAATHRSALRTAWYSGRPDLPESLSEQRSTGEAACQCNGLSGAAGPFDYIKLGPYIEELGGLKSPTTNQRLYKRVGDGTPESPFAWQDITSAFWQNRFG